MPSLKDLRTRIQSVQSTRKITAAMKMIAAAKLRKAQERVEEARPYAIYMAQMLKSLLTREEKVGKLPQLLLGTGRDERHLLVLMTSNRGLCGGFNGGIVRHARHLARELQAQKKQTVFYCIGQKAYDQLRREYEGAIVCHVAGPNNPTFLDAEQLALDLIQRFEQGEFDICTLIYYRFKSALQQEVTTHRLIPFTNLPDDFDLYRLKQLPHVTTSSVYEYEPDQESLLADLIPRNMKTQVFRAMLENLASEHGARMSAMDGATRNAEEMLGNLTLTYNRMRQAAITKELIEIISGADAL